ncbi:MAG: hypothetical protein JWP69_164 [Flaviaesturariibacter sp.]|nr:hypothetical protein [Flaviaesturariibacter sp.]
MSVHTPVEKAGIYFITLTCQGWLPLLKSKGHTVTGYVIMPNHIHLLLHYNGTEKNLNPLIGNGKRFIAYDIVKGLQQKGEDALLKQMQDSLQWKDGQKGKSMRYGRLALM